jgi:F1F0 ATPase subunit 2
MATKIWEYAPAFIGGLVTGGLYFGGLWLTVRHVVHARRPALMLWTSFLVRASIALAAFYVVMGGNWLRLAACMAGFLIMRQVLTWRLGPRGSAPPRMGKGSPI